MHFAKHLLFLPHQCLYSFPGNRLVKEFLKIHTDDPNPEALRWILKARDGEAEFLANKSQVFLFSQLLEASTIITPQLKLIMKGKVAFVEAGGLFLKKFYIFDPDSWRDKFLSVVTKDILLTKFCQKCFYGKYKIDFYFSLSYMVCSIINYYIHTHTL